MDDFAHAITDLSNAVMTMLYVLAFIQAVITVVVITILILMLRKMK